MIPFLEIIFWACLALLVYTYGGFSFVVSLAGRILNRNVTKADITPKVSMIVAAFNEKNGIAKKLENIIALDYPEDKLEVIVASDGSDDGTNEIVEDYVSDRVSFLNLPRRGKIFALNDAVAQASGEILVFSDANTHFDSQALRKLARNFNDPNVGGVCGNQKHLTQKGGDNSGKGEMLYWSYDKWLKIMQSRTGSIVSADGAIYAIRRELYEMPAFTDVTDDFAISTGVVEKGYRLVFEEEALAFENAYSKAKTEFNRKTRIMNRGLRGVILRKRLLNPFRYGFYSVILFSHKVLRRLIPFFLVMMYAVSLLLAQNSPFFLAVLFGQSAFYAAAAAGYLFRDTKLGHFKLLYIPFFYCLANAAALVAIIRLLRGKRIELWQPQRDRAEHDLVESEIMHS